MIEKKGKRHIKPNTGSSLWISKTPLIKNHKNIKKTFFLLSSTMWKYSQLFIIHSNKGKPQHGQPNVTFGSVFGAYISNKIPKAILCWLTLLKSTDHIILGQIPSISIHTDFILILHILIMCILMILISPALVLNYLLYRMKPPCVHLLLP